MPVFELEASLSRHPAARSAEAAPTPDPTVTAVRSPTFTVQQELDGYYKRMQQYPSMEPDEVMLDLSGIAARLTEIRSQLVRDGGQRTNALRTREVDPLLEQIDLQFKLHSRIQSIREFDWRMTNGAV